MLFTRSAWPYVRWDKVILLCVWVKVHGRLARVSRPHRTPRQRGHVGKRGRGRWAGDFRHKSACHYFFLKLKRHLNILNYSYRIIRVLRIPISWNTNILEENRQLLLLFFCFHSLFIFIQRYVGTLIACLLPTDVFTYFHLLLANRHAVAYYFIKKYLCTYLVG